MPNGDPRDGFFYPTLTLQSARISANFVESMIRFPNCGGLSRMPHTHGGLLYSTSDHPSYDTWIGATDDVQEMTFLWYGIDEPLSHGYTNWAHHEPEGRDDDDDDEQDCVYINSHDWEWHDHECDDDMYYICEKP